jgi:hypothetical protein
MSTALAMNRNEPTLTPVKTPLVNITLEEIENCINFHNKERNTIDIRSFDQEFLSDLLSMWEAVSHLSEYDTIDEIIEHLDDMQSAYITGKSEAYKYENDPKVNEFAELNLNMELRFMQVIRKVLAAVYRIDDRICFNQPDA